MSDSGLQYSIEVDDSPAQAGTARVNKAFDVVSATAKKAGAEAHAAFTSMTAGIVASAGLLEQGFKAAGSAAVALGSFILHASEAAAAAGTAFALFTGKLGAYAASAGGATGITDQLIGTLRTLRLTASAVMPEVFGSFTVAAGTVGLGIAIEETVRLVNARAKLIEQQSLFSAVNEVPVQAVERTDAIARAAGLNSGSLRTLYSTLDDRIDNNQSDVRAGLNTLGVGSYLGKPGEEIDDRLLSQIAHGFDSITDPAKRAAAAVKIFGDEKAGLALKELGPAFEDGARAIDRFGVTLTDVQRNNIFSFRQDLLQIKEFFTDFSDFSAFGQKLGIMFESAAARGEQAMKRFFIWFDSVTQRLPGAQEFRQLGSGLSDDEIKEQAGEILGAALENRQNKSATAAVRSATDTLIKQAYASDAERANTPEGIRAALSSAQSRRDEALKALRMDDANRKIDSDNRQVPLLTDSQRLAYATEYSSTAQLTNTLQSQVDALENQRRQAVAQRASQELVYRSAFDAGAGKDLRGEILKDTTFTDKDGALRTIQLTDQTRRNLETAFHTYAVDLQKKAAEAQLKSEDEIYAARQKYEQQIFEKRQQFQQATLEMEVATDDKVFAHQEQLLSYRRDEQLAALTGTAPQTVRGKLGLEQAKLGVETDYITQNAALQSEDITRARDRQLSDLAAQRVSGQIGDREYFDRSAAINRSAGEQGAELNDKYQHDLLMAQQQAATQSTEIVRSAQEKEFSSLKESVNGVLDAMETKSQSVFGAIAHSLKAAFLGAFNEIVSSQIAAALFQILNPGTHVSFDSSQAGGKMGGFLGALGMGTHPVFSGGNTAAATLKISTDTNTSATAQNTAAIDRLTSALSGGGRGSAPAPSRSFGGTVSPVGSLAGMAMMGLLPLAATGLAISGAGGAAATGTTGTAVSESISFDGGGTADLGGTAVSGLGGGFRSESLGIPGGMSIPGLPGIGGAGSSGGFLGILGGTAKGGGLLSGSGAGFLTGLLGSATKDGAFNQLLGGAFHPGNTVGLAGNLSQLGHSPAAALAGGMLVMDGLRRGGFAGTLEDTGGGALLGFKFGGPIGAAIGAAAGLGAGLIRQFFFGGDRQHAKDLVKQVYGMDINNATADQIVQIAKQSYGAQIDVAVRSQQVRDLLKLYAEATGSSAQKQFVADQVHSASLVEAGGKLQQGAVYDNGQAYTYSSNLPTLNGISSSILPTAGRNAGAVTVQNLSLQLNGQAASDVLAGQVGRVATPSFIQNNAIAAQQSSIGRSSATTMALAPSAIVQ